MRFFRRKHHQMEPEHGSTGRFNKTILAIADVHANPLDLPDWEPDLILLLGDIPCPMIKKLDQFFHCPKLGVLGNHDGADDLEGTSILNVHARRVELAGLRVAGFGGAPRYSAKPHGQYTEDEAHAFVDDLGYVDVFLAHANPQWVSDVSQDDVAHAGFQAFASYINQAQPAHFFHGHLHERYDKQVRGTTVHAVYQAQVIVI